MNTQSLNSINSLPQNGPMAHVDLVVQHAEFMPSCELNHGVKRAARMGFHSAACSEAAELADGLQDFAHFAIRHQWPGI